MSIYKNNDKTRQRLQKSKKLQCNYTNCEKLQTELQKTSRLVALAPNIDFSTLFPVTCSTKNCHKFSKFSVNH